MAKRAKTIRRRRKPKFLIFIDTNILLDFYRVRGREAGLTILDHINENLGRFITGSQVEMEFKKHRQRVIVEAHAGLKAPSMEGLQLPAFLAEAKQSKALGRNQEELRRLSKALKDRISTILHKPTTQDAVYRVTQRLFRFESPWNLDRSKKIRHSIRRLARKRFCLGYPPRKSDDTSMGDAINWEWVIHCAIESRCNVIIVSRDTDYGISFGGTPVINDWLLQEFRDRVGKKRKLVLTDRLSVALKLADITVTKQEEESEKQFVRNLPKPPSTFVGGGTPRITALEMNELFAKAGFIVHPEDDSPWFDGANEAAEGPEYHDGSDENGPDDNGPDDDGPDDYEPDDGPGDDGPGDDGPDDYEPDDDGPDDDGPDDDGPDDYEPDDDGPDDDGPDDDGPDDDGPDDYEPDDDGPDDDGPDDGPDDDGPDDGPDDYEPDDEEPGQ